MNYVVLDVAIGLVFIYTLYSLLATTINELVATVFSYRGRMLERGLEQMLDGKNYSIYWWDKILIYLKMFKYKPTEKKEQKTSIVEQAIDYCKDPTNQVLDQTKFCAKITLFAAEFTNHELYKRSSADSFFSKKPAYLISSVFSDILLDILNPKPKGETLTLKDIAGELIRRKNDPDDPLNEGIFNILNLYITKAEGNLQLFRTLVEGWYDETMNRVSGWYKKQTFRVLLTIGFVLAVIFNVGTIDIVQKLSTDKTVRDAIVKSASAYVESHQDAINGPITKCNTDTLLTDSCAIDTSGNVKNFEDIKAGIRKIDAIYNESVKEQNAVLGLGWGDFGYQSAYLTWRKTIDPVLLSMRAKKSLDEIEAFRKPLIKIFEKQPKPKSLWQKVRISFTMRNLIGFLITAFAISLGAPFWFDLLNKFVNLRATGAKPPEATKTTAV